MGVSGSGAPRRGEGWRLWVRLVLAGGVLVGAWWLAEGLLGGSSAQAHDCVDRYGSGAFSYGEAEGANSGHGHFCGVRSTTPPTPTTAPPSNGGVSDPESLSPIDRSGQHSAPHGYWHANHADRSHCGDGDHYYHDRYTRARSCGGASSDGDACVSGRHRHTYSGSWCHPDHTAANGDCRTHRDDGTHEANPCPDDDADDDDDACVAGRHRHTYSGSWCHLDHTEANGDCRTHRDDGTHEANPCPDDDADDGDGGCSVALGALGAGTVTRSGTWAAGCTSDNRGSAQVPYRAVRYTFSVAGAATATVGVSSSTDAYVYLTNADRSLSRHDNNSGAHSGDALLSAVTLAAAGYTVEATTAAPRQDGAFTMTLTIADAPDPPPAVVISGLADASATPAAGAATAAASDTFGVTPADATCTATPHGAAIAPAAGTSRTVTHTVAAGTTVTVTVTCMTSTSTASADARFTADAAPVPDVEIDGLDHASATPDTDSTSAEVSDTFGVTPAAARCSAQATPGTPQVAPATGTSRTVTLDVAAGTTVWVIVICDHRTNRDLAAARFTAHPAPTNTDTTTPPPTTTPPATPPATAPACPSGGASGGATTRSATSGPPGSGGGSCPAPEPADRCSTALSLPQPGADSHTGSITNDTGCTSSLRSSSSGTYYARRHTFTLDAPGWVTVDLHSDPAERPRLDTYLVLSGDSLDRPIRNDDARDPNGHYYDSRIGPLLLPAGDYVAEATTYGIGDTGSYTLTAEVTAAGLTESHTATVDAPKTVSFDYWPADAKIAVKTAAAEEFGLTVTTARHAAYGTATVTLTPRLVHDHHITIRITSNSGARERQIPISLTAACPTAPVLPGGPSLAASTHNSVLCIQAGTTDAAPETDTGPWGTDYRYEVAPGVLNGILESARAALNARADRLTCGLTVNKLAAYLLSVGHHEIRKTEENSQSRHIFRPRTPARSAMALSRGDTTSDFMYSDGARNSTPKRAFFHPGVGWWQIDDQGSWPHLNHGERSQTGLGPDDDEEDSGGEAIAEMMAGKYCDLSGGDAEMQMLFESNTWYGCQSGGCYASSGLIYLDSSDDLYVTVSENRDDYSTSGGITSHRCRWDVARAAEPVPCFFHDPTRGGHEGWLSNWAPTNIVGATSPLAAPFISFTYGPETSQKRFAVFPGEILEMFESGSFSTRYKSVPKASNVRWVQGVWSSGTYNQGTTTTPLSATLEIEVCEETEWVTSVDRRCDWHSVDDGQFPETMGVDSP